MSTQNEEVTSLGEDTKAKPEALPRPPMLWLLIPLGLLVLLALLSRG